MSKKNIKTTGSNFYQNFILLFFLIAIAVFLPDNKNAFNLPKFFTVKIFNIALLFFICLDHIRSAGSALNAGARRAGSSAGSTSARIDPEGFSSKDPSSQFFLSPGFAALKPGRLITASIFLILSVAVSSINSPCPQLFNEKFSDIFAVFVSSFFMALLARSRSLDGEKLLFVLPVLSAVPLFYAGLQLAGADPVNWNLENNAINPIFSTFGNVNIFAVFLNFCLPINIYTAFIEDHGPVKKNLSRFILFANLFFTYQTFNKFPIFIAALTIAAILAVLYFKGGPKTCGAKLETRNNDEPESRMKTGAADNMESRRMLKSDTAGLEVPNRRIFKTTAISLIAIIIFISAIDIINHRRGAYSFYAWTKDTMAASFESRILMYKAAVSIFSDHPLTGAGLGSFRFLSPKAMADIFSEPGNTRLAAYSGIAADVHNDYLQILCECGVISLALFLFICGSACVNLLKAADREGNRFTQKAFFALIAFISLLMNAAVSFPFSNPLLLLLFTVTIIYSAGDKNMAAANSDNYNKNTGSETAYIPEPPASSEKAGIDINNSPEFKISKSQPLENENAQNSISDEIYDISRNKGAFPLSMAHAQIQARHTQIPASSPSRSTVIHSPLFRYSAAAFIMAVLLFSFYFEALPRLMSDRYMKAGGDLLASGDTKNAFKSLVNSLTWHEHNGEALFLLSSVYFITGFDADGMKYLNDAARYMDDAVIYQNRAYYYFRAGDIENSERNIGTAYAYNPYRINSSTALNLMGKLKFISGDINEAMAYFKKSIHKNEYMIESRFNMTDLYVLAGDMVSAGRSNEWIDDAALSAALSYNRQNHIFQYNEKLIEAFRVKAAIKKALITTVNKNSPWVRGCFSADIAAGVETELFKLAINRFNKAFTLPGLNLFSKTILKNNFLVYNIRGYSSMQ